jgi:hypothetical protein
MRFAQKAKRWSGAQRVPGDSWVDFCLDGKAFFGSHPLAKAAWQD